MLVGRAQLLTRVDPAILAAQPLAVEQVRARELGAQPGAAQPLDRLAIQALGARARRSAAPASAPRCQRPLGAGRSRRRRQPLERVARELGVARARRRLDQLGQRPRRHLRLERVRVACRGRGARLVIAAEAVVQDRRAQSRPVRRRFPCPPSWRRDRSHDQLLRPRFRPCSAASPSTAYGAKAGPGRRRYALDLGDQRGGTARSRRSIRSTCASTVDVRSAARECAGVADDLDLSRADRDAALVVPHCGLAPVATQPHRRHVLDGRSSATAAAARAESERPRRMSLGDQQSEAVEQQVGWRRGRSAGGAEAARGDLGQTAGGRRQLPGEERRAMPRGTSRGRARASSGSSRLAAFEQQRRGVAPSADANATWARSRSTCGRARTRRAARPPPRPAAERRRRTRRPGTRLRGGQRAIRAPRRVRVIATARWRNAAAAASPPRAARGRPSARAPRRPARQAPPRPQPDATRAGPGRLADRSPPPTPDGPRGGPPPRCPVYRGANQRMTEGHPRAERQQAVCLRVHGRPRCRAARTRARAAADRRPARRRDEQQTPRVSESTSSRRTKLSSIRPDSACASSSPKPPASCVAVKPRGSSSNASGFPRVSAMIRSRTRSSNLNRNAELSSARARRGKPLTSSSGTARSSSPGSRAANTIPTGSANRRRATNASVSAEACPATARHRRRTAAAAPRPPPRTGSSTANPTRNRSGAAPALSPNTISRACRCGAGSPSSRSSSGAHN